MGEITCDHFISSCTEFVALSDAVGDNWEIVRDGPHVLIQRNTAISVTTKKSDDVIEDMLDDITKDSVDDDNTEQISCRYEMH